jgi:hypothetical protein
LLAIGTLALLVRPIVTVGGVRLALFDAGGIVAAAGMMLSAIVAMMRHVRVLYAAEPLNAGKQTATVAPAVSVP